MSRIVKPLDEDQENNVSNIFRSEDMVYLQIYMSNDAAHDTVYEFGLAGIVQFVDLNKNLSVVQRTFSSQIQKCSEIERILRILRDLLAREKLLEPAEQLILPEHNELQKNFAGLEHQLLDYEKLFAEEERHISELTKSLNRSLENLQVLSRCESLLESRSNAHMQKTDFNRRSLLSGSTESSEIRPDYAVGKVEMITGNTPVSKVEVLERVLFRVTRGNFVIYFADETDWIQDPDTDTKVEKKVFVLFYYSSALGARIKKVLDSLECSAYEFVKSDGERQAKKKELAESIRELRAVLSRSHETKRKELENISKNYKAWCRNIAREKAILYVLNLFENDSRRSCVIAEAWCPRKRLADVQATLQYGMERSGAQVPSVCSEIPTTDVSPTYFQTNKLTTAFQSIVDAYGIGCYHEMNPMPFSVITFPFLFAVMFGDIGHGILMLISVGYVLYYENYYLSKRNHEIFDMFFKGRYVILLMALFSIYVGFLYNETFSMSFDLFGSAYEISHQLNDEGEEVPVVQKVGETYAFGLDPIWKQSMNELTFTNSMKMKMSIVFGVAQMAFGIILSAKNHIFFKDWISFVNLFIPQLLFLMSIFGYMVILILTKWGTSYEGNTHCAPSILTLFIDMFLGFGAVNPIDQSCNIYGFFDGQVEFQRFLIIVSFLCVPWMLFGKPILEYRKHQVENPYGQFDMKSEEKKLKKSKKAGKGEDEEDLSSEEGKTDMATEHHYDLAEELIHQVIHTIEFVLGAISNTASYLRLWALSLAHGQLSTVFWEKTVVAVLESGGNPFALMISFFIWVCCTIGVLMVMESLSAFLHALRLHWVEFQGKFYSGTGKKFVPFVFPQDYTLERGD